jgi:predicted nuclease of predicted toxin-antitoxin system
MSSVGFLLDEHIPHSVARGLERRGVRALTPTDAEHLGAKDDWLMKRARSLQAVLVTQDSDFLSLAAQGLPHGGIVFVKRKTSVGQLIRALLALADRYEPGEMENQIAFV